METRNRTCSENGKRVVKILADEIKKINERYPHFDVIITDDYMSRPAVNEIVKDIVIKNILPLFFWSYIRGGLLLQTTTKTGGLLLEEIR